MYTKEQIEYLRKREAEEGLPPGILAELATKESSQGRNMLNPASGAAGHYGIMPFNYEGKFDPNDFKASTEWTISYAKEALAKLPELEKQFPGIDAATAIRAHHYGGPNTGMWGPQTKTYAGLVEGSTPTPSPGENTMPPGILDPEALSIDVPDIGGLLASLGGGGPNVTPPMNQAQEHLWAQLAQIPGVGGQQTQPSSPGFGQRALTNPWLQMGLGILTADPSRGPLAAIAGGVQKGLLGVNAAEQQQIENQQREQQREQARMWQSLQAAQTMQDILKQAEKFRSDGRIKPQDLASVAAANYNVMRAKELEQKLANPGTGKPSSVGLALFDSASGGQITELIPSAAGGYIDARTGKPIQVAPGQEVGRLQSGGTVGPTKTTDAQKKGMSSIALAKADTKMLIDLATRAENPVDLGGLKGLWLEWQAKPELMSQIAQWGVGKVVPGLKATPDQLAALSALSRLEVNLLAAARGAQVGPKEQIMFRRSIPVPGSSDYLERLRMAERNLKIAENIAAEGRREKLPYPEAGTDLSGALTEFLGTPAGALSLEAERLGITDPAAMESFVSSRLPAGAGSSSGGGASLSDADKTREAELKAKYPWLK